MAFIIYHKETTRMHTNRRTRREWWATEGAAKAEQTRSGLDKNMWLIEDYTHFLDNIEKTEVVYSIHDREKKKPITQSVNTPLCCDPSSETYWTI